MRLLITGASGQLGGYLLRQVATEGVSTVGWSRTRIGRLFGVDLQPVDLSEPDRVAAAFREARPDAVLHAAALATVAACYQDPSHAQAVNARGTQILAELCAETRARLLLVSTDLVFDGEHAPYREADPAGPLSVYGRTKAAAEPAVLEIPRGVVVRVSLLFGPTLVNRPYFFDEQLSALRQGRLVKLFRDEWRTPLGLATAASALVGILRSDFTGLLHLGGPERLSRLEMGQRLAHHLSADFSKIVAAERSSLPTAEPRARDVSLDSNRWRRLFPEVRWPFWEEALAEMGVNRPGT